MLLRHGRLVRRGGARPWTSSAVLKFRAGSFSGRRENRASAKGLLIGPHGSTVGRLGEEVGVRIRPGL